MRWSDAYLVVLRPGEIHEIDLSRKSCEKMNILDDFECCVTYSFARQGLGPERE